jgi:hypothetical protein
VNINLLGENINTKKVNIQTLGNVNNNVILGKKNGELEYMFMSCHNNAGQNYNIKMW